LDGGSSEDPDVESESSLLNVETVVANLSPDADERRVVPDEQLRQSGDSGWDAAAFHVVRNGDSQLANEFRPLRSRTNETHFPPKHVP
jgi:hypothetical protein